MIFTFTSEVFGKCAGHQLLIECSCVLFTQSRGIRLAEWKDTQNHHEDEEGLPHHLSMHGAHPSGEKVHLDADGNLVWPVLFLYPEHGQTDFIAAFSEHHRYIRSVYR